MKEKKFEKVVQYREDLKPNILIFLPIALIITIIWEIYAWSYADNISLILNTIMQTAFIILIIRELIKLSDSNVFWREIKDGRSN